MGSPVAAFVWREVVGKRWISFAVWQAVISSFIFLVWEFAVKVCSQRAEDDIDRPILKALWTCVRFFSFQTSQMCFLFGQTFISEPEEREMASI
ncbi:unnamed protein product [Calypogeia fissa]